MRKRMIALVLIALLILTLTACGKQPEKTTKDIMKEKTTELVNAIPNPTNLRNFEISEESDGIYVTCTLRYAISGYHLSAMKPLYFDAFIQSMFDAFPEMVSLLIDLQGIEDNHIYNCLYVRDGDTFEVVDEIEIQ